MGLKNRQSKLLLSLAFLLSSLNSSMAQTSGSDTEIWPMVSITYDLGTRSRIQGYYKKHDGEDFSLDQWRVGTLFTYRMKRMLRERGHEIDDENKYNLVVGGGYEFIHTDQNGSMKREHRVILESSPNRVLGSDEY